MSDQSSVDEVATTSLFGWQHFVDLANEYTKTERRFLFRGQAGNWPLTSSLARALPSRITEKDVRDAESVALRYFSERAPLFGNGPLPDQSAISTQNHIASWWPVMQHHGAPTRLLDWSLSPYVGLYFAVEQLLDEPGFVYIVDGPAVTEHAKNALPAWTPKDFLDESVPSAILVMRSQVLRERVAAQQGFFTIPSRPLGHHGELLAEAGALVGRIKISHHLKPEFLRQLRFMNVTAHTLFGGIDGLGRAAGELVRSTTRKMYFSSVAELTSF